MHTIVITKLAKHTIVLITKPIYMNTELLIEKLQDAITCAKQLEICRKSIKELSDIAVENERRPYDPVLSQLVKVQSSEMIESAKITRDNFKALLAQNITDAVRVIADPIIDLTGVVVSAEGELQPLHTLTPDGDE